MTEIEPKSSEKIVSRVIEDEMQESYLEYAMSVIVGRALPDVRDGLKPVHRRILYALYDMGMLHNKPFKKSARIVGEVLGKYHPHGDTAVYDSLVRMAQDFSLRYPLVQGQGNFGSVDGDNAAAMRYCVTGDSLIVTEKGLVKIDELSDKEKININILSKDKKINKASKWFDSGEHPTLQITTNKGYSLTGTYNHPLLTLSKDEEGRPAFAWKLMENLKEGEFVVIDRSSDNLWPKEKIDTLSFHPEIKNTTRVRKLPEFIDEDLAFILGSFISEGSLTENKIEFCNTDEIWINELTAAWNRVFPDSKLHKFKRKPSSYGKKEYYRLECHCRYTIQFLNKIGLNILKSSERQIPKTMFNSPKEVVTSFLKAYFEGDGSISFSKKMIELSCCSKSEKLMKDIQILLLRFGIDSFKRFDKHKSIWKLYLRGYRNVLRFYKEIGFCYGYKNKKLEYVVYSYKKDNSLFDFVPFISEFIRSKTNSSFVKKNNFDRYSNMEKNHKGITSILLQETGIDYSLLFEYFLNYNYLFDQVTEVKQAGVQKVYSIKVESDCHSFISNGFISHNTEARLAKIAEELLEDIKKETVDFTPNFDGSLKEPSVLPAKLPNLLINGTSGIAVGMATNIPPHNINEVIDASIVLIDNPESSIQDLMQYVKGPDFPTGATILGNNGIKTAYMNGRGIVKVRAKTNIEELKGKTRIIVTEIPYMVNKSMLIEEIANLIRSKKVLGISDLRDESDREGMRILIELKKDANPNVLLNQLYKHTRLETSFGMNMLALVNNEPKTLNLKQILQHYIDHRKDVVTKRTKFDLKEAEARLHVLVGLIIALNNINPIVKGIKESKTVGDASNFLIKNYQLSEIQAKAILEMRLQKLSSLEQDKIKQENNDLTKFATELKDILANESKIFGIIKDELTELKQKYGDERKTNFGEYDGEIEIEDLIEKEDVVVTMSHAGYVKRLAVDTYRAQKRGGKGIIGAETREEDFIEHLFVANTHSYILFFSNKGKVYWLKVHNMPEAGRQAKGKAIINLLQLDQDEKINAFIPVKEFDDQHFLVLATKKGTVKKTNLKEYSRPRQGGIIGIVLEQGDELIGAELTNGQQNIMLATKNGLAIKFDEKNARAIGRTSKGVRGIALKNEDEVVSLILPEENKSILTVTENGFGKRTKEEEYRVIGRAGVGVINIQCSERNGKVVNVQCLNENDEIMFVSQNGIIIRVQTSDISMIGRNTQGVRLMRMKEGDKVVAAAKVVSE